MHHIMNSQLKEVRLVSKLRGLSPMQSRRPSLSIDLLKAASTASDLPSSILAGFSQYDLCGRVKVEIDGALDASSDVFRGLLRVPNHPRPRTPVPSTASFNGLLVAVKRHRPQTGGKSGIELVQHTLNELRIWMSLGHYNVLPCLGFMICEQVPCLVSEWMTNGNVMSYLSVHPGFDRHSLISGIACGLEYLHSRGIIHSDLKSANILISSDGRPMISNFRDSRLDSVKNISTIRPSAFGSVRWMGRELLLHDKSGSAPCTKESDVWSFGMVVYEIISGEFPFHDLQEPQVIMEIVSGQLPKRPTVDENCIKGLDDIWSVCTCCWATNPTDRPTMDSVLRQLNAIRVKGGIPIESNDKILRCEQERECAMKLSPIAPLIDNPFSTVEPLDRRNIFFLQDLDVTKRLQIGHIRAQGGSADIYEGVLKRDAHSRNLYPIKVAVKKFRLVLNSSSESIDKPRQEQTSSFTRELKVWINLSHANILPCLGFAKYDTHPALISEWLENGSLLQYLNENTHANKLQMAKGIACGLEYIHSVGVIHGDLKGANVLIDHDGRPMLTDFGNSYVVARDGSASGIYPLRFSLRWVAIELLDQPDSELHRFQTKESDIWAYGMVLYEIISQKLPYYHLEEFSVLAELLVGNLPKRPTVWFISRRTVNRLWNVCLRCWAKDPADRPTATQIVQTLVSLKSGW